MRLSRETWLKTICGLMVALAAAPASAQVLAPFLLAADGDEPRPASDKVDYWIGVRCVEVPASLRAQLDLPEGQGVLVDDVVADSPARQAGLKAFDVIVTVDGKAVADPHALASAVASAEAREMKIEYLRAGRKQTMTVKPAPRPETQDQRALRQWVERLGQGPAPMKFRFFHPGTGMVLPPGASLAPALPDDMTVTIEKQGNKPAKVTAKQGDQKWEADEYALDKLPTPARDFAERMLGLGMFDFDMGFAPPRGTAVAPNWLPERRDLDGRLDRRLEEMKREIDELRRAFEKQRRQPSVERQEDK